LRKRGGERRRRAREVTQVLLVQGLTAKGHEHDGILAPRRPAGVLKREALADEIQGLAPQSAHDLDGGVVDDERADVFGDGAAEMLLAGRVDDAGLTTNALRRPAAQLCVDVREAEQVAAGFLPKRQALARGDEARIRIEVRLVRGVAEQTA